MGFLEAVQTCLFRKFANFEGRAARAEYWWFFLFAFLLSMLGAAFGPLIFVVAAVLFVPNLAVTVRRLHDTNRTGWWILLSAVSWIPLVGWIAGLVLLWFMVQKGDSGDNRYGPNPVPAAVPGHVGAPPPPPPPPPSG